MRARTSPSQACGSTLLSLAVPISVYMNAARSPPRSEPANSHAFLPSAMPRRARSAALLVRQMRPSVRNRVKSLGAEYVRLDQQIQRPERRGAGADLVGERRQAELHAFAGIAVALSVERLVRPELLEQDHGEEARPEQTARGGVERRRRLRSAAPPR